MSARDLLRRVHDFYLAPLPQQGMVGARIVLGLSLCLTYATRLPGSELLFGPDGLAGHAFYARHPVAPQLNQRVMPGLDLLARVPWEGVILALHVLIVLAALAFALGAWTRSAGAITLLLHALFYARNSFVYEGSWAEWVHAPLFYVVCSEAGRHLSIDAWRARARGEPPAPWRGPGWPVRLLQIHVACEYVAAGWSRLDKESWWSGEMVFVALSGATHSRLVIDWAPFLPLLRLGTWGALALEILAPVMLWVPRVGRYWALGLIALHFGLELLTNVGWWGPVMIAGNLAFVLPWNARTVVREERLDALAHRA